MLTLLILAGTFLPCQDAGIEKISRHRNLIVFKASARVVQTDRGEGEILASRGGLTIARIPVGSAKATITTDSNRTSTIAIDEIDFSGGMSVTVQVLDDAVEVERDENEGPVAVVVYRERGGRDPEFHSATIVSLSGTTRVPLPVNGVAYVFSASGAGAVFAALPFSSAWNYDGWHRDKSGFSVSTGGIFGLDLDVEGSSDVRTTQTVFFGEFMEATQSLHLENESWTLAELELGFEIFPWWQVSLSGLYGNFDADGTLETDLSLLPGSPQVSDIDVEGRLYGFGIGNWWPLLHYGPSPSLQLKVGPTASFRWIVQEYEDFSTPDGDRGGAPELYDFTSELEGEEDRFVSGSAGVRASLQWELSPSTRMGFQVGSRWSFGDFSGLALDSGLSVDIRF